jgi:hypothetical protein
VKPSSDASTGDAAPEDAAGTAEKHDMPEVPENPGKAGREDGAVAIPKQTAAAEAADSEAGEGARQ